MKAIETYELIATTMVYLWNTKHSRKLSKAESHSLVAQIVVKFLQDFGRKVPSLTLLESKAWEYLVIQLTPKGPDDPSCAPIPAEYEWVECPVNFVNAA